MTEQAELFCGCRYVVRPDNSRHRCSLPNAGGSRTSDLALDTVVECDCGQRYVWQYSSSQYGNVDDYSDGWGWESLSHWRPKHRRARRLLRGAYAEERGIEIVTVQDVPRMCRECKHPVAWHDGDPDFYPGCQFAFASTAKGGGGVGGSAMTACGCTAVAAPDRKSE